LDEENMTVLLEAGLSSCM